VSVKRSVGRASEKEKTRKRAKLSKSDRQGISAKAAKTERSGVARSIERSVG
jgi:hypothetical protein